MDFSDYNINLCRGHFQVNQPDWSWDSNENELEGIGLWLIKKGSLELKTSTQTYTLKAGDCYFLQPDKH